MFVTDPFRFQKTLRLATSTAALSAAAVAVGLNRTLRVSLSLRTYSVSPTSTGLRKASRIAAGVRSTAITGVSTRVLRNRKVSAALRTYAIAPQASFMQRSRVNGMTKADITLAPQAIGLLFKHKLSAGARSLAVQGIAANFLKVAGELDASLQSVAVAPVSLVLRKASRLSGSLQSLSISPTATGVFRGRKVEGGVQSVDVAAVATTLLKSSRLAAVKADYNIAQVTTQLTYTQPNIDIAYASDQMSTSTLTTFTFSGEALGSGDRWAILAICPGAAVAISSVSVGGETASVLYAPSSSTVTPQWWKVWLPSSVGATGTVSIVVAASSNNLAFHLWTVGANWDGTADVTSDGGAAAKNPSLTISVPANGRVFVAARNVASSAITWTNATQRAQLSGDSMRTGAADFSNGSSGVSRTITANASSTRMSAVTIAP